MEIHGGLGKNFQKTYPIYSMVSTFKHGHIRFSK